MYAVQYDLKHPWWPQEATFLAQKVNHTTTKIQNDSVWVSCFYVGGSWTFYMSVPTSVQFFIVPLGENQLAAEHR